MVCCKVVQQTGIEWRHNIGRAGVGPDVRISAKVQDARRTRDIRLDPVKLLIDGDTACLVDRLRIAGSVQMGDSDMINIQLGRGGCAVALEFDPERIAGSAACAAVKGDLELSGCNVFAAKVGIDHYIIDECCAHIGQDNIIARQSLIASHPEGNSKGTAIDVHAFSEKGCDIGAFLSVPVSDLLIDIPSVGAPAVSGQAAPLVAVGCKRDAVASRTCGVLNPALTVVPGIEVEGSLTRQQHIVLKTRVEHRRCVERGVGAGNTYQ